MEVTKSNFLEALEKIGKLLPSIDFVSFDAEFTGLGTTQDNRYTDLDTVHERYRKGRKAVLEHGMIQLGLSFFRFSAEQKKYFSSTFCFFLAGKKEGYYKYDVSGMRFLAENGFDFNKLFLEGLHFMSFNEEHEIRTKRELKLAEEIVLPSPIKSMDKDAKKFVRESMKKVHHSKLSGEKISFPGSSLSGFHRKLLYNNVACDFPTALFRSTRDSDRNIEVIHFDSLQEKDAFVYKLWEEDLLEKIGFTRVVSLLLKSGKPIITHNGFLDILHFTDKFIAPLPENFEDFQLLWKANIPSIYDTKLLAKDPPFSAGIPNSGLGNLYKELCSDYSPPEVLIEQGLESYKITEDTGQQHDAGYDAYMTGVCFLIMLKKLDGAKWASSNPIKSKKLVDYCNKINFMFSYDHAFIDLYEKQEMPDRNHLLTFVCPSTYTMNDTRNLLRKISSYKVIWVNDAKFHVILEDHPNSSALARIIKELSSNCPPNVFVTKYKIPDSSPSLIKAIKPLSPSGAQESGNRKRSSGPDYSHSPGNDESNGTVPKRDLKRLKSIGSTMLAEMTLESPSQETPKPIEISPEKMKEDLEEKFDDKDFNVPDEW